MNTRHYVKHHIYLLVVAIMPGCARQKPQFKSHAPLEIDDFSRLNKTIIHQLATPATYQELQSLLDYAKNNNLKISIAGTQHSQGGQSFFPNAIVISLKKLNSITHFDPHNKTITVQAGATWKEVQDFLNPHKLALATTQFINVFTVGGSLSVNANGIDPHYGPLIESVESIKILCADGSLVTASRTKNAQLFSLAIGGYGLFGIIIEATLKVVDNDLYALTNKTLSIKEYVNFVKTVSTDPDLGFHFGCLGFTPGGKKLFSDINCFNFKKINTHHLPLRMQRKKQKLYRERFVEARKSSVYFLAKNRWIKSFCATIIDHPYGRLGSRNNIMRPPANHSYTELSDSTNLLQEYFIPVDNLPAFIEKLETLTVQLHHNLMWVQLRFIPKNNESFLSYTHTDCIGLALFFNQKLNDADNQKTKEWTQQLISTAIALGGTYYLPTQLHATQQQITQAYPTIEQFFALKKQYDPHELFMNHFYQKYA